MATTNNNNNKAEDLVQVEASIRKKQDIPDDRQLMLAMENWNCRDVKIGCDQDLPACRKCIQSKMKCLRYGLRLSWPRASDRRRVIILNRRTLPAKQGLSFGRLRFLNTSTWDIDIHNEIMQTGHHRGHINSGKLGPRSSHTISKPMSTSWGAVKVGDQVLLSYYESVLSRMITTADDDRIGFRHVLLKLALSENLYLLKRFFRAYLLSSLTICPRVAPGLNMISLRSMLYRYLYAYQQSPRPILPACREHGLVHLRGKFAFRFAPVVCFESRARGISFATMIATFDVLLTLLLLGANLSLLEKVFNTSESRWTMFFCGAKKIAKSIFAGSHNYDGEPAFLLDWVYGQDTLSEFSLLFWPRKDIARRNRGKDTYLLSKIEDSPHRSLVSPAPDSALVPSLRSYENLA